MMDDSRQSEHSVTDGSPDEEDTKRARTSGEESVPASSSDPMDVGMSTGGPPAPHSAPKRTR